MPEPTTAPVTAEDARERVAVAIEARVKASVLPERPPYDGSVGLTHFVGASFHDLADVALTALAGDPGDLPARMEAALEALMRRNGWDGERNEQADREMAEIVETFTAVAQEHAARQAAEVERLRGELETAHEERDAARLVSKGRTMEQYDAIERAEKAEAERDALKAATEKGEVARFAADVLSLVDDYSDKEQSVIARLPFLATFDQLCFEKYGFSTEPDAALAVPESTEDVSRENPGPAETRHDHD